MANYPGSVFAPATHNTGDIIQASDVNLPNNEIIAIEQDLVNGAIRVSLIPNVDVTRNIGSAAFRWASVYASALQALDVASRSNYVLVTAAITGAAPSIKASGASDANIGLIINPLGTGAVTIASSAVSATTAAVTLTVPVTVNSTLAVTGASTVAALQVSGAITPNADNTLSIGTSALRFVNLSLAGGINPAGSVSFTLGQSAPATGATAGFPYMPSMSGAPGGTPTAIAGFAPFTWNDTGKTLNVYSSGAAAWQALGASLLTAGATNTQTFTSGSGTYTTPVGTKLLWVRIVGGGGGGGGSNSSSISAGSGGSGGYVEYFTTSPSATYSYAVGAGGSGGGGGSAGTSGAATTFGTSLLNAGGGTGGGPNNGSNSTGGTATGGTINIPGIAGQITPSTVNIGWIGPASVMGSFGQGGGGGSTNASGLAGTAGFIIAVAF